MSTEHPTQNAIMRWIALHPQARVYRRNVGAAEFGKHKVRFGIKGQSDLYGHVVGGRCFEIEVKARTGRLSKEQKAWAELCNRLQIPHVVAYCVEDVWQLFRTAFPDLEWLPPQ